MRDFIRTLLEVRRLLFECALLLVEFLGLFCGVVFESFKKGRVVAIRRILHYAHLDDFADLLTLFEYVTATRYDLFALRNGLVTLRKNGIAGSPEQKAQAQTKQQRDTRKIGAIL